MAAFALEIASFTFMCLCFASACAHHAAAPPDVVRAFATSVALGQWERAYGLMSDDYRRRVSLTKFQSEMEAERRTVNADATVLSRQPFHGQARAVVEMAGRDRFTLVLDGTAWKLDEQPLAPFSQHSPRAALRTLVRAIDQRRYDVVMRLVPTRHRSGVTEESLRLYWEGSASASHRRLLEILRANLDAPIIDLGTEANMPYGSDGPKNQNNDVSDEGEVRFLLEEGAWKIGEVS